MSSCNTTLTPIETSLNLMKKDSSNPVNPTPYKQMVGSLQYLCVTRANITYGVGLIRRYIESLK